MTLTGAQLGVNRNFIAIMCKYAYNGTLFDTHEVCHMPSNPDNPDTASDWKSWLNDSERSKAAECEHRRTYYRDMANHETATLFALRNRANGRRRVAMKKEGSGTISKDTDS
jgi:hypothetical protein